MFTMILLMQHVRKEMHAKLDALRKKYGDSDENDKKFLPAKTN
jgi:hypothetical protein